MVWLACTISVPRLRLPSSDSIDSADSARASTARASMRNSVPASVSSMPRLQPRDRRTDRRLGEVKCLGGPGHMLAFGDRDEDTKLFKCHGGIITGRPP